MSDQDTSVFENNQPESDQTPQEQPTPTSLFADQLKSIKNEKGEQKYASVEDALKGAANAQEFIAQLKAEKEAERKRIEELESKVSTMSNFEQQLAELKALQNQGNPGEKTPVQGNAQGSNEDLASLVQKEIAKLQSQENQTKQEQKYSENELMVSNQLSARFGEKAGEVLRAKAQELGVSIDDLREQSRKSPSITLALFNQSATSTKSPSTSSYNPSKVEPGVTRPPKSMLAGATSKEQVDYFQTLRQEVYKKHGVNPN